MTKNQPISDGKRRWTVPAIYPHGRVAEFVATAKTEILCSVSDLATYVVENEHQEGAEWISQSETLQDALEDFKLYLKHEFKVE